MTYIANRPGNQIQRSALREFMNVSFLQDDTISWSKLARYMQTLGQVILSGSSVWDKNI